MCCKAIERQNNLSYSSNLFWKVIPITKINNWWCISNTQLRWHANMRCRDIKYKLMCTVYPNEIIPNLSIFTLLSLMDLTNHILSSFSILSLTPQWINLASYSSTISLIILWSRYQQLIKEINRDWLLHYPSCTDSVSSHEPSKFTHSLPQQNSQLPISCLQLPLLLIFMTKHVFQGGCILSFILVPQADYGRADTKRTCMGHECKKYNARRFLQNRDISRYMNNVIKLVKVHKACLDLNFTFNK
jgi:hypothetical protein